MRTRKIAYLVTTALFSLLMLASGFFDITLPPDLAKGMTGLGYPLYFVVILGVWKLLGVAAIASPGLPRLKEWAYAGFFFDLSGAVISHIVKGEPFVIPLVLLAIGLASWATRPSSRMLGSIGVPALAGTNEREPVAAMS